MSSFTHENSIVRKIWGDADVILLIAAGSAAEYSLHRSVDWLAFTGSLLRDPIGRIFETVGFAQAIAFGSEQQSNAKLAQINAIHKAVERRRGQPMPDWAHRDVLYLMMDYAERGYALLHRPLTSEEQEGLYQYTRRVGEGLGIQGLPANYEEWRRHRDTVMTENLLHSVHTENLEKSFLRDLGPWRFQLLRQMQRLITPEPVRQLLGIPPLPGSVAVMHLFRLLVASGLRGLVQKTLIPASHLPAVQSLDQFREA
ncbi:MAG: oxygenase MpaB family protein [Cystobacter sp.]